MTTTTRQRPTGGLRRALATTAATVALAIGATVAGQAAPAVAAESTAAVTSQRAVVANTATAQAIAQPMSAVGAVAGVATANWWDKTAAFVGCIFGVGVPIGLAWAVATNPAWLAFFLGRGPLPASAGGAAYNYWNWVRSTCAYALF